MTSSRAKRNVAAAALVLAGGCILPPPVAIEQAENHAPVIANETAKPQKSFVELNLNCTSCVFSVRVDDRDIENELTYRWFVDYNPARPTDSLQTCNGTVGQVGDPNAFRDLVSCALPLSTAFGTEELDDTEHSLEVWISDQGFEGFRSVPEGGFAVVKQWTVRLVTRGINCDDPERLSCVRERPMQ